MMNCYLIGMIEIQFIGVAKASAFGSSKSYSVVAALTDFIDISPYITSSINHSSSPTVSATVSAEIPILSSNIALLRVLF